MDKLLVLLVSVIGCGLLVSMLWGRHSRSRRDSDGRATHDGVARLHAEVIVLLPRRDRGGPGSGGPADTAA